MHFYVRHDGLSVNEDEVVIFKVWGWIIPNLISKKFQMDEYQYLKKSEKPKQS